jgi:hypothetical protein
VQQGTYAMFKTTTSMCCHSNTRVRHMRTAIVEPWEASKIHMMPASLHPLPAPFARPSSAGGCRRLKTPASSGSCPVPLLRVRLSLLG